MGHARHGIHSMWRDDSFLLSLQRGEPDIYVNPDDAAKRGVKDGDLIRTFSGDNDKNYFKIELWKNPSYWDPAFAATLETWQPIIGKAILESWGLPQRICEAVENQDYLLDGGSAVEVKRFGGRS